MSDKYLDKMLVGKTVQGEVVFIGWCQSYTESPTIGAVTPDGEVVNWHADLCTVVDLEPAAVDLLSKICRENRAKKESDK